MTSSILSKYKISVPSLILLASMALRVSGVEGSIPCTSLYFNWQICMFYLYGNSQIVNRQIDSYKKKQIIIWDSIVQRKWQIESSDICTCPSPTYFYNLSPPHVKFVSSPQPIETCRVRNLKGRFIWIRPTSPLPKKFLYAWGGGQFAHFIDIYYVYHYRSCHIFKPFVNQYLFRGN